MFDKIKLRRLRQNKNIRNLLKETTLTKNDFIYPVFVKESISNKIEIKSMPNIFQYPLNLVIDEIKEIRDLGIPGIILFGIPENKDKQGSEAYNSNGIIQKTIRKIKNEVPDILCIADLCLCEYTSHGHCGILKKNNDVDNDATLKLLAQTALTYANEGVDMIAPSGMMDGSVKIIRETLDSNNFSDTSILAYSAKFASSFYGPFRDAAESPPQFGNRDTYQLPVYNTNEALREIEFDINEGADIIMIKPALAYLDIIAQTKNKFNVPVAAYNVSGEYSMIKATGKMKILDEKKVRDEVLYSIKRAGADIIISYFAKEWAVEN